MKLPCAGGKGINETPLCSKHQVGKSQLKCGRLKGTCWCQASDIKMMMIQLVMKCSNQRVGQSKVNRGIVLPR